MQSTQLQSTQLQEQVNPCTEDYFAQYMDWAEAQNAIIEREQKSRYVPTDDDIFAVDFQD